MKNPPYSGPISSTDGSNIVAIAPQTGQFFRSGEIFHDGTSGAGAFSLDGGATWVDFKAAPFSMPLPAGSYDQGVLVKRTSSTDLAGLEVVLYA